MSKKKDVEKKNQSKIEEEKEIKVEVNEEAPEVEEEKKEPTTEEIIAGLQNEVTLWKDRYMRNMAEFDNFRRRSQKEKSDWIKTATEGIVISLCDVMDNFERAWSQLAAEEQEHPFIKGVKQIEQQLWTILSREGVEKVESLKENFDPNVHEALAHIPSEHEENVIAAVIQNGYKLNGKIIRPARVAVSNGQKPQVPPTEEIKDENE
ncbi:MAG: nucleotide exchange factor GrpE [Candidatus Cloacimonetes bacterium]|nr:nucleotide exchange factor GrpE [Candidatus Cloacimonadota bacterium]